jgi:uncharacterized protein YecE (DUF72 family)
MWLLSKGEGGVAKLSEWRKSVRVLSGTSGFSYAAWNGVFYPPRLPAGARLAHYASRLETVEANATFYRVPRPEVLAGWHTQVPPGFVFSLKAPRRLTHERQLRGGEEVLGAFLRAAAELAEALGPILYQLPPTLPRDLPRLRDFLALLPRGAASAFEFRHPSWFHDGTLAALSDAGAALCAAESDEALPLVVTTARFGYLRLRRSEYGRGDLERWTERILAQPWREAFVYFKHEDEARGPAYALALRSLVAGRGARPDSSSPTEQ